MAAPAVDKVFAGSVPRIYASHLVPLIFEPYAADLATRLASRPVARVLEVAAGTGVVTRRLAAVLPPHIGIVATDLNAPMLEMAQATGTSRAVEWQRADAMELPFPDASFDAVVCQFGVMFFPDKVKAYREAHRVLRPRGVLLFNVWDRIEENDFANVVTAALARVFPEDPPRFMARTPHGYWDRAAIEQDLAAAGFSAGIRFDTVSARSRADSAFDVAFAFCQGTPLRNEIEARDASRLELATQVAAEAVAERFGPGPVEGRIRAHIVAVER